MTIRVQGPDGSIIEFPEGTSPATMQSAMQAHYGGQQKPAAYQLADKLGMGQVLGALDGLQHHALNAPHGLAQLVEHGANAAANLLPSGNPVRGYVNRAVAADDAALAQRERDYQARTQGNAGSYLGATVGEIAPWAVGVGEMKAAGLLPQATSTLGKAGLLTGEGAAMGAATPVTSGDFAGEKAKQIGVGAVGGAALPVAGKAAGMGFDLANRFIAPQKAADAAVLRALTPDMLPQLEQASGVPGVVRTVAEAAPSPRAVKLERRLRNDPIAGLPFANRDVSNDAARLDAIRGIAGTDADMQAALAARRAATGPAFGALPAANADPAPALEAIGRLRGTSLGVRPTISGALNDLESTIRANISPDGTINADVLHGLRQNAGEFLAKHANPLRPVGTQEEVAIAPVKDAIVGTLDAAVPGYRDSLATYARLSQPVNDMEAAGRVLADAGYNGPNASGDPVATLAILKRALKSDDKARFSFSDDARAKMDAVLKSAQDRAAVNNTIAAAGPASTADRLLANKHAPKVRQSVSAVLGGLLGGHLGMPGGEVVGGGLGLLAGHAVEHANDRLALLTAERMANAQKAAEILRAAQRKQGLLGPLPNYLLPYGAPNIPLLQQTP